MLGQTISHYRIDKRLGAGGMGEVFEATDTQLGRAVAIKVVSEKILADPDLRRRFVQEAKTASSLHHPNVVAIYDVGRHDDQHFIAMELVPGVTLDEKIGSHGMPVRHAIQYSIQIADALSSAHAAGIVHRDLKPGNVMVTAAEQIKLLDFGLAKRDAPFGGSATSETEVLGSSVAPMTEVGTIVGTVFYMSPEQAEGKHVDARSDIFSFGAMLYEMLSGKKAFGAETKMAALTAILHKEPVPLQNLPARLTSLLQRCLRKDPQRRAQSMADVRVELEDILAELDAPAPAKPTVEDKPSRRWMLPALAGAAVGALPAFYVGQRGLSRQASIRFQRLTYRRGDLFGARFAPGGNIVYSAEWDGSAPGVFVTQQGVREARDLNLPNARVAAVSHKGELALIQGGIKFGSAGLLTRVPIGGSLPREVLKDVSCADWAADGEQLAVGRIVEGKVRLDFPIGTALWQGEGRPIPTLRIAPGGQRIAFGEYDRTTGDYALMVWENNQSRMLQRGFRAITELCWSATGTEVWVGGTRLGEEPAIFGVDLTGRMRVVSQTAGWPFLHDILPDGRVLMTQSNSRLGIRARVPSAPEGRELAWYEASLPYAISADGQQVILAELSYGEGRNSAVFLRKTDGSAAVRLGYGNRPALSPDGLWVACIQREATGTSVKLLPTGAGEPRTVIRSGYTVEAAEWIDAQRLLVAAAKGKEALRSWVCEINGGEPRPITEPGKRAQFPGPQGEVLMRQGAGYLRRSLEGNETRPVAGLTPADAITGWASDGKQLLVRRTTPKGLQLDRVDPTTGARKTLHEIAPMEPGAFFLPYGALTPDGQWWLCSYQRDLATLYTIDGLA